MADFIGITGLVLTIFDQILKLGERTDQLISDIRAFDEDTKQLQQQIRVENSRNGLLKTLLFSESNIYETKTLFESFPEDIQEEIKLDLGEAETVIGEAIKILEKKYGRAASPSSKAPGGLSPAATPHSKSYFSSATNSWFSTSTSPIQLISWSMKGKKRVENVVKHFVDLNGRIREKIKLCSLALTSGIDLKGHLKRLQIDTAAKQLGFDLDANLRLMADTSPDSSLSLEMAPKAFAAEVSACMPVEESFFLGVWKGSTVLFEQRSHQGDSSEPRTLDTRTVARIEALAKLLQQPRETVFRIPPCSWWTYLPDQHRIFLAFKIESGLGQVPVSLQKLLDLDLKLSLNKKFVLAYSLARCLSQFQVVGWVHESFRSNNILFWTAEKISLHPTDPEAYLEADLEAKLDYAQPWVLGFEFSRPEADFSSGFKDICKERDIYRHPERQGLPNKRFMKIHDIYSLGIVLLEIGIWSTALTIGGSGIGDARNPRKVQAWYIRQAERRLESRMGRRYKEIVLRCLKGDFGINPGTDTMSELRLQQEFRRKVVDVLERAKDNV